eukprot:GHVO01052277.1.p1 GENE.GHVO01052277.1~~GHVO01052277.1.p1  ORF type:complete len:118 (-),score=31.21 GHVO01052277.1:51-359(-)
MKPNEIEELLSPAITSMQQPAVVQTYLDRYLNESSSSSSLQLIDDADRVAVIRSQRLEKAVRSLKRAEEMIAGKAKAKTKGGRGTRKRRKVPPPPEMGHSPV